MTTPTSTKAGSGELRHDAGPITMRFPALAGMTAVTWMSGTLGDDRVPGPSTYWIDAVVHLPDADIAALSTGAGELRERPEVVRTIAEPLRSSIPAGRLLGSERLSAELSPDGFSTIAVLVEGTDAVVLSSRFE